MDTTVIIIMIICATVIALVAIICDHLFERKVEQSDSVLSKKIIKIHRNYIAGFLGFAVIMLITAKYGGPENAIFTYLSFGSTITSLVLSILAIFVTVQSSTDLYKQFGTINKVSNQIDGTLKHLIDAETKLEQTSSTITCQMNDIVDEIEKRLDARVQKTEDALSKQIQKQNVNLQSNISDVKSNLDTNAFLNRIPYNGLLALYACSKGKENKKSFKLSQLFKGNEKYQLGLIMATIAAGYLSADVHALGGQYMIRCDDCLFKSDDVFDTIKTQATSYNAKADDDINDINVYFDKVND